MKKLLLVAVAGILFQAAAIAQSVALRFEGANANTGNEQNFTVDIDGTRYYSFNAESKGTSRARVLDINSLPLGAHTIKVYRNNTNTTISSTGNESPLY